MKFSLSKKRKKIVCAKLNKNIQKWTNKHLRLLNMTRKKEDFVIWFIFVWWFYIYLELIKRECIGYKWSNYNCVIGSNHHITSILAIVFDAKKTEFKLFTLNETTITTNERKIVTFEREKKKIVSFSMILVARHPNKLLPSYTLIYIYFSLSTLN